MSEFDNNLRPFPWYRRGKVRTPLASGIVTPSIQGSLQASDIKSGNGEPLCDELALLGSSGCVEDLEILEKMERNLEEEEAFVVHPPRV